MWGLTCLEGGATEVEGITHARSVLRSLSRASSPARRVLHGHTQKESGYLCFRPPLQALEVIHRHGMSAALFAPGWVFETQDKSHFFQSQDM